MKYSQYHIFPFKTLIFFILIIFLSGCSNCESANKNVLIITGGHEFDRINFFKMFDSLTDVEYDEIVHPVANNIYSSDSIDKYSAIIFYDMYQDISENQRIAFINMLYKGIGLVFIHHSLCSYQDWAEFRDIIGGKYHLQNTFDHNNKMISSGYRHDTDILVQIADKKHPITRGIKEFTVHGEGYNNIEILSSVHPILFTTHPDCDKINGWTNTYGNSRIVYIQSGHDNNAFSNNNYRKLLNQAIDWVSDKR